MKLEIDLQKPVLIGRLPRGAWIEISIRLLPPTPQSVASLAEAWIEMFINVEYLQPKYGVASLAEAWIEIYYMILL